MFDISKFRCTPCQKGHKSYSVKTSHSAVKIKTNDLKAHFTSLDNDLMQQMFLPELCNYILTFLVSYRLQEPVRNHIWLGYFEFPSIILVEVAGNYF